MKKASGIKDSDEMRAEYDLFKLRGGSRGKDYKPTIAGTKMFLIDPDLTGAFPRCQVR